MAMNLSMISNYVKAKWSKGLNEKKVDVTTKDIRLLGCFGNGEDIPVCSALRPSQRKMGKFFCGACGCGDKATTWLNGDESEYTKLDHPFLSCPKKMPGFSDYESGGDDERKKMIESVLGDEVLKMDKLVKPQKEEEEKPKKKGCTSCSIKAEVRKEVMEQIQAEGIEINDKDVKFNSRFRELYYSDERIINLGKKENGFCPSCERKKQIREEVLEELKDSGLSEEELAKKVSQTVQERFRKEQQDNLS